MYNLLSLSGGGCWGAFQAGVLSKVPEITGCINGVAGTSVGSINGANLVYGNLDADYITRFQEMAKSIFYKISWTDYVIPPRYKDKNLNDVLKAMFKNKRLGDTDKDFWVVAWNLDSRRAKVFYSKDTEDASLLVWEVVRSSIAAPTYFDPWKGYIDGGLAANNPAMIGIAGAAAKHSRSVLDDMKVLSIGNGVEINNDNLGRYLSYFGWAKYIFEALFRGASYDVPVYQAKSILGDRYAHIDFMSNKSSGMDNPNVVDYILKNHQEEMNLAAAKLKEFLTNE